MEEKAVASKDRILASAEKLFARKGFDGARVEEIARHAGVNKALIYYYFPGKKEILNTLFDDFLRHCASFFIEMARGNHAFESEETEHTMARYRGYLESKKDLLKVLMTESLKGGTPDPPVFTLVDFAHLTDLEEGAVMKNLQARGFKLDEDRNQRMVTEFFTGILPDICYIIFRDQWSAHFRLTGEKLDELYRNAIEMTHKAHYREK